MSKLLLILLLVSPLAFASGNTVDPPVDPPTTPDPPDPPSPDPDPPSKSIDRGDGCGEGPGKCLGDLYWPKSLVDGEFIK